MPERPLRRIYVDPPSLLLRLSARMMSCSDTLVSGASPTEIKSKAYHNNAEVPMMAAAIRHHDAKPHPSSSIGIAATADKNATSSPTRAHGNISTNADRDYFKIYLAYGYSYRIDVKGSEPSEQGGTLVDPRLDLKNRLGADANSGYNRIRTIISDNSTGTRISDDDSGAGNNARLQFEVRLSGNYYIEVSENGNNATGTYTVQAIVVR